MPRSAYLTNIANGLCGSFASRNNDLDGYWTIGKLCSLAGHYGHTKVLLDLLAPSMQPPSSEFAPVLARYQRLLGKLAALSGIGLDDITTARIAVDFAPSPWPRARYDQPHWGEQFVLTVSVFANGRAEGIGRHTGYCRPHDPAAERRSGRA